MFDMQSAINVSLSKTPNPKTLHECGRECADLGSSQSGQADQKDNSFAILNPQNKNQPCSYTFQDEKAAPSSKMHIPFHQGSTYANLMSPPITYSVNYPELTNDLSLQ